MSSTNKTKNLQLNSWIGSDKPKREDFNADNSIIDKAITDHVEDNTVHITSEERGIWNNYMFTGTYYGNGTTERVIETECPFEARIGFVFANSRPTSIARFSDGKKNNYFGVFGFMANSLGLKLDSGGKKFTVEQSAYAMTSGEYANYNESGVTYHYMMFR